MPVLNDHKDRAHALLSASGAHRWLACPASAKLAERYEEQDTAYTQEGTFAHEVAEHLAKGGTADEILETLSCDFDIEEMIRHGEGYAAYIEEKCIPSSSVLLESRVDFSEWVPEGFGTADCILLHPDGCMDVIDYKYGKGVEVSSVENPQMMLYGLGALSGYGFVYDISTIRLHIYQPRMSNISVYELSVDDLLKFGEYAKDRAALAMSPESNLHMASGAHCKFCPHAGRCRELALDCISDVSSPDGIAPDVCTLSSDDLARLLLLEPVITSWLKKVKARALTDLMNGEDIPGYKVVEGKLGNRKWTDELAVAQTLEKAGFAKEDFTTLELLSPAEMDKAIGKKKVAELLSSLINRAPGSPTVVPQTDKRPKLDRLAQAQEDFKED